jgi:hypothetical protein
MITSEMLISNHNSQGLNKGLQSGLHLLSPENARTASEDCNVFFVTPAEIADYVTGMGK